MRFRSFLTLMVFIALAPGFIAAFIAIEKLRNEQRQTALHALQETVRATSLLVDRDIQGAVASLRALSVSDTLKRGDFAAFHAQAAELNELPIRWTLLLDESGRQLVNSSLPFTSPLKSTALNPDLIAKALVTGQPVLSDIQTGVMNSQLRTMVYLACNIGNKKYVLAQALALAHWTHVIVQPPGQDDVVVGVIDRQGRFIARTRRAPEFLGRSARPELVELAATTHEGMFRHKTWDGVDSYDAFTHTELTQWTVAVAAPVASIEAAAARAVEMLYVGVAIAFVLAGAAAAWFARVFIRSLDTSFQAARALGSGQQPVLQRTSLREISTLNAALVEAGRILSEERSAREFAEAQRQQLLLQETQARELAQAQNEAKDKFLALLSHELRNPLAAIAGANAVLKKTGVNPELSMRYVEMIGRQTQHLTHIVNDLLDVSRMVTGKVVLQMARLDLGECVRHCLNALASNPSAIEYVIVPELEAVWIKGDAVRIEQIVNNLINNAIKYSEPGSAIHIATRAQGEHAILEVADQGEGIPADVLPKIFEPFVQGPGFKGGLQSGLGIGLALVKQLVELHGGSIEAHSDAMQAGTKITITLPLHS